MNSQDNLAAASTGTPFSEPGQANPYLTKTLDVIEKERFKRGQFEYLLIERLKECYQRIVHIKNRVQTLVDDCCLNLELNKEQIFGQSIIGIEESMNQLKERLEGKSFSRDRKLTKAYTRQVLSALERIVKTASSSANKSGDEDTIVEGRVNTADNIVADIGNERTTIDAIETEQTSQPYVLSVFHGLARSAHRIQLLLSEMGPGDTTRKHRRCITELNLLAQEIYETTRGIQLDSQDNLDFWTEAENEIEDRIDKIEAQQHPSLGKLLNFHWLNKRIKRLQRLKSSQRRILAGLAERRLIALLKKSDFPMMI